MEQGLPGSAAADGSARSPLRARLARLTHEPAPLAALEALPWHSWIVVGLVCIGAFVGQLDATIVQLALPTLATTFDAGLHAVSWVSLGYLVAFASFLPIFGRLCQMVGRKTLYLLGYLVFVAASASCALAPDLPSLVTARVVQGIGGALLGANSIAILIAAVPEEKRGRALGVFAAAQAIGMSAGPAVGGIVLGALGWPWIFWLTVPFGILAAIAGWIALPRTRGARPEARFDWLGALLLAPALVILVRALNHAAGWGLTSPETIGSVVLSAGLIWLLVRQERRAAFPLVDLKLFANPGFALGAGAVVLGYAMLYAMFFLMSFLLEHGYGEQAWAAGLRLAVIPVILGLVAPFSGGLADRLGIRLLGASGMGVCLLGLLVLGLGVGDPAVSPLMSFGAFLLFGAGLGLFIAPNNHDTLKAAPPELATQAGSLLNLMRVLGTSLGVAGATSTLSLGLKQAGGLTDRMRDVSGPALVNAVEWGIVLVAIMALIAAFLCVLRHRRS